MKEIKYLQPLDQMARISRAELGGRLDEILDIVDKDNVGFVITDKGKDDLVLCPARWMECIYSEHEKQKIESPYVGIEFTIDSDLYDKVDVIFKRHGLTHEEAIPLFLKETVRLGKIPFEYTREDILEAKRLGGEMDDDGE